MIKEDFYTGSGYDGLSWWARASGITGSINDHISATLEKCGYTGSLNDKVTAWGRRLFGDSALSVNDINRKLVEQNFYNSLTFFKDYVNASGLDADFSIGSPTATYTSTSGTPTLDANGYSATTANDDVLKYAISGNRTAAQETIVIKFMPSSDFVNDGIKRRLITTDTKNRSLLKDLTNTVVSCFPNFTDNGTVFAQTTTSILASISYTLACTISHNSPYIVVFTNGVSEGSLPSAGDFTSPTWGTSMYIGSSNSGAEQVDATIQKILFFNRVLTAAEVALVV